MCTETYILVEINSQGSPVTRIDYKSHVQVMLVIVEFLQSVNHTFLISYLMSSVFVVVHCLTLDQRVAHRNYDDYNSQDRSYLSSEKVIAVDL